MHNDEFRQKRIEDKIDILLSHMAHVDITLARQELQLREHIRRTELLETALQTIERNHMKWAIALVGALLAIVFKLMTRA